MDSCPQCGMCPWRRFISLITETKAAAGFAGQSCGSRIGAHALVMLPKCLRLVLGTEDLMAIAASMPGLVTPLANLSLVRSLVAINNARPVYKPISPVSRWVCGWCLGAGIRLGTCEVMVPHAGKHHPAAQAASLELASCLRWFNWV